MQTLEKHFYFKGGVDLSENTGLLTELTVKQARLRKFLMSLLASL
jgi:hypothetical protein